MTSNIIIECATDTCDTLLIIRRDDYLPKTPWYCPRCAELKTTKPKEPMRHAV